MPPSAPARNGLPNYGLDAPGVVRSLGATGIALIIVGALFRSFGEGSIAKLGVTLLWPGGSLLATSLLMVLSSKVGKLRARDRLLDRFNLRGDETILDVGCGHGLLLIGAAHRVPRGRAIGVDLWSQTDQYANSAEATLANAEAEGVAERVMVQNGDMRTLPLDDASIDVAVSSLAIHNVPTADDRAKAIREIVRVLKPGGRIGILDIANVGAYATELRAAGCTIEHNGLCPWIFPPTRELFARKGS